MGRTVLSLIGLTLLLGTTGASADIHNDPNLVIHYSFDDFGRFVYDESGKGHDGTTQGDVAPFGEPHHLAAKFAGKGGPAGFSYFDLDGANFPAGDIPRTGITLAAWARCDNTGDHHAIFNARATDATWVIHPELRSNNMFRWLLRAAGGVVLFDMQVPGVVWGEWVHYAGMYDKATAKATLYINGKVAGQQTIASAREIAGDWGQGARVGYNIDNARAFTGLMDELFLFKRVLSEAELQEAMALPPQLKAYGPNPPDGAKSVIVPFLQWNAGDTAAFHELYLGKSPDLGLADLVLPASRATNYVAKSDLEPGTTYYWRVDEIEKDMTTIHTGDVWSFTAQGLTAYLPDPAHGAVDASPTPNLVWMPSQGAYQHHVYFGTSFDAVSQGAADTDKGIRALDDANFAPGALESLTTYYWSVDETLVDDTIRPGPVWSFTTFLPVDDFESYTDEVGRRIFQTWIDGVGYTEPTVVPGNGSGATVGYTEPPFAEQRIVHGGKQSMPMDYNNVKAPNDSAAQRTFAPTVDWTVNGATSLVVYLRGKTTNKPATLYLSIDDASGHNAWTEPWDQAMVTRSKWTEWRIPIALFATLGVDMTRVKQVKIGLYDKPDTGGASGTVYIDDIRVIKAPSGQ